MSRFKVAIFKILAFVITHFIVDKTLIWVYSIIITKRLSKLFEQLITIIYSYLHGII